MQRIKNIFFLTLIIAFFNSCIEEYIPNIKSSDLNKYVVSGILTDQEGYQEISVSLTSPVSNPLLIPVKDCQVELSDSNNNSVPFTEYKSGLYRAWISQDFLNIGMTYQIKVITPDGSNIVSDFEEMIECPDIDSVYYIREDIPTNDPEFDIQGIQFYLDLDAQNTNATHFKIDIEETWEYHAMYPLEWYYDGTVHQVFPPDYSKFVCWKTEQVKNIFVLNTSNLEINKYRKLPLQYVDNKTSRLAYGYSVLIKQYSINENAFIYWEQLQKNNLNDASLYDTQPISAKGNLHNLTNENSNVLGYFQVSSVKTKRIFVSPLDDLELDYYMYCYSMLIRKDYKEYGPDDYPVYLLQPGFELNKECIICTSLGGTTKKPDFWP